MQLRMNNTKTLVALGITQIEDKQNRKHNTESKHDVQHGPHKNIWGKHRCARRISISWQHNGEKKAEKRTNNYICIYKTLHRKLKIEQHESTKNREWIRVLRKD
jgi:hypothetical protein